MPIKILAISGSLRAASLNSALLRAMARLAGDDVQIILYDGIGNLPLFNRDFPIEFVVMTDALFESVLLRMRRE